jgi:hypothetical protein
MCGRSTFQPTEAFYRRFNLANRLDGLVARYNIAPSQMVPVIGVSANRVHGCGRFNLQNLTSFPRPSRVECPHIAMTSGGHEADPRDTQRSLA